MKTITKIAIGALLFFAAIVGTSCKDDEGSLDGLYQFGYIYDVTFEADNLYNNEVIRVSLKEEGTLEKFLEQNGNMGIDAFSFRFSGSDCQMLIDGELEATGTYELHNGKRLVLNFLQKYKSLLTVEYRKSPVPMFIWDRATFNTMGLVMLRVYGLPSGYTVSQYQICVAMKK